MELYLQFGYGMMEHCRMLLTSWNGGTAILSPRDLNDEQLERMARVIDGIPSGQLLLDPQFYLPHADHERLCAHAFWPSDYQTGAFWQGPPLADLLTSLSTLNERLGCRAFILPGMLATNINDDWLETQRAVVAEATAIRPALPLIMTIALAADAVRSEEQIARLLEDSENWRTPVYYIVCEHPNGDYLVSDPNWLANVVDLAAGLRLGGAEVILGYCNQQMLIASIAKVNAIASGTWMNVRSFPPEKFQAAYDEEIRQRATWYYCPQALSEYKVPFLDIARRQNLLALMAPPTDIDGSYSTPLFSGAAPSSVGFGEQAAFRHYLHALRGQALAAVRDSFDETCSAHEQMLNSASDLLARLIAGGIRGQLRDFLEIVDVNRAALELIRSTRGAMLRRAWVRL
ncbi:MAG: hypothetical protein KGM47_14415 [Acidobacteriota bacterium]|nr:hypothetical protein [Acidobacteriota bacterium]